MEEISLVRLRYFRSARHIWVSQESTTDSQEAKIVSITIKQQSISHYEKYLNHLEVEEEGAS